MIRHKNVSGWLICLLIGAPASVLLLASCSAHRKPTTAETKLANMVKEVIIPIEAGKVKNPIAATDQSIQKGKQVFNQNCALCHGADGHAATPLGLAMYPPAMDLTSPHVQQWSQAALFWIIQNGIALTGMPSWKNRVSTDDTWRMVDFIHALPRLQALQAAAPEAQTATLTQAQLIEYGKKLYRQEGCFSCHQLNGQGGKVGPDLTKEGTRGRSNAWLIGHFEDPAAYTPGSVMPSFKNLTNRQLQALTAFLQSEKGAKE